MQDKKLTLLYKSFDDVVSTIRALDTKLSYIIAIVIFVGGSYFTITKDLHNDFAIYFLFLKSFFTLFFTISLIFFLLAFQPRQNPTNVFKTLEEIQKKDLFYIDTISGQLDLNTLTTDFQENILNNENIEKVLLVERDKNHFDLIKPSYLEDIIDRLLYDIKYTVKKC